MKIAVCDDEPHDLDLLCALIRRYNSGLDLTTFQRASALLDAFQSDFYDLVFWIRASQGKLNECI